MGTCEQQVIAITYSGVNAGVREVGGIPKKTLDSVLARFLRSLGFKCTHIAAPVAAKFI
jgi:hypothetical protein